MLGWASQMGLKGSGPSKEEMGRLENEFGADTSQILGCCVKSREGKEEMDRGGLPKTTSPATRWLRTVASSGAVAVARSGSSETTSPATRWLRMVARSGAVVVAGSDDVCGCAREWRRWQGVMTVEPLPAIQLRFYLPDDGWPASLGWR
ncbi:hypothetical protein Droror1_Dr00002374 [Drosera rotundifolia]